MSSMNYNLEKLYGVLKTYELEIHQDEEIEKSQRKDKIMALVAKYKEDRIKESSDKEFHIAKDELILSLKRKNLLRSC